MSSSKSTATGVPASRQYPNVCPCNVRDTLQLMRDRSCHPAGHRELFGLDHHLFGPFAVGDVTDYFGGSNYPALSIFDRRNRHRNVQDFAIFSEAFGLLMVDPFSRSQLSQDVLFLVLQRLGDKAED
jgi:hypothetical protein